MLAKHFTKPSKTWWCTLAILLVLTLIFDNVAIGLGMFSYNPDRILGIYIGLTPIEDFFYALLACIIVPLLWERFKPTQRTKVNKS
ncbi:MAG: lycopene cyclase domain-containing protein [Candidatus Saccharimonadaceae bacterium]